MNALTPIAEGFVEGLQLARALVWTIPKTVAVLVGSLVISFVLHQQFNADAVLKAIESARHA